MQVPKLLVVTDVAIRKTYGGSILLYRLLENYPADRLLIVERQDAAGDLPDGISLSGVDYRKIKYRSTRWSKFSVIRYLYAKYLASSSYSVKLLEDSVKSWNPDVVFSLSADFVWLAAYRYAKSKKIPYVLASYDDWPTTIARATSGKVVNYFSGLLGTIAREANAMIAVSPNMAELYERYYGVQATLLYPARGIDSPQPNSYHNSPAKSELAFIGNPTTSGTAQQLRKLQVALRANGARVNVYCPWSQDQLSEIGLESDCFRAAGFYKPMDLARVVEHENSAQLLIASFDDKYKKDVSTLFPSKLVEYTGIGLPILFWGPSYSSAARWFREFPGAGCVVTQEDPVECYRVFDSLLKDQSLAEATVEKATHAGMKCFDSTESKERFVRLLLSTCSNKQQSS